MLMNFRPRADLRTLIALLVIISIVITLANNLYATWRVQRMVLIDSTLEANRAYAAKLASTSEVFFVWRSHSCTLVPMYWERISITKNC